MVNCEGKIKMASEKVSRKMVLEIKDVRRFAYESFRLQVDSPTSRSFRLHDQVVSPTQFE